MEQKKRSNRDVLESKEKEARRHSEWITAKKFGLEVAAQRRYQPKFADS